MTDTVFDAVVVGGGPAGLSAALWLARYRRTTLVLDDEQPRNEFAWAVHGYPGIPDPHPAELGDQLKEQAADAGARFHHCRVAAVKGRKGAFEVRDEAGLATRARRVIMAYGRTDQLPDVPGLLELYGRSVFHCPDCDGPDMLDRDVGIIGHDQGAATLALLLRTWARSTTLLTDGLDPDLEPAARDVLAKHGVDIRTEPLLRLEGKDGVLRRVDLEGDAMELDAVFFHWGSEPSSTLAQQLGCECTARGDIRVDRRTMETSVAGVHAAGDIVGHPHLAIIAAAEGVRAALAIHRSLLPAEFQL